MALGDERRGIGRRNEAARRAIGSGNEAARRAIGDRITAERRGDQVADDINRLRRPEPRRSPPLRTVAPVGPVPAAQGRGVYNPPPAVAPTGGGIASPLTETPGTREWHATGYPSSDGIFEYPAEKTVRMTDANGDPVELRYAAPAL